MKSSVFFIFSAVLANISLTTHVSGNPFKVLQEKEILPIDNILVPEKPIEEEVFFYLYTRSQPEPQVIYPGDRNLLRATFNFQKPTKFLIHGFFGGHDRPMVQEIKDSYMEAEDVNIIAVDWGEIARHINYFVIVSRLPDVALYFSQLLDFLVSEGANPKTFHLIGHSLGAHVAGFAGNFVLKGKLGRITGLDPARPKFQHVDNSRRLDKSDADFVDNIHTCGGLLGIMEPLGHADFYVNGGTNIQPGCNFFDLGRCSHRRAHQVFAESILPNHKFPALKCNNFNYEPGDCGYSDVFMGNNINSSVNGIYFVHTNDKYPYGMLDNRS